MGTIFSSTDIRGRIGESDTTEYIWNAGKAFAEWLPEGRDVVVVKTQSADDNTAHAFVEGLLLQGRTVIDAGTGDQSTLVDTIRESKATGGVLIDRDIAQNLTVVMLYDHMATPIMAESGLSEVNQLIEAGNFLPAAEKGTIVTKK